MSSTPSTFVSANGDSYELLMGRWSRRLAEPYVNFVGLSDGDRILDAGCGTGALSAHLLRRTTASEIVGMDFSKVYVDHATSTIEDPRITFATGDVANLAYDDGVFDQVFSNLVLTFVPDSTAAITELKRVVKPGGSISATVWDSRGGLIFNRLFLDTAAVLDPKAHALRQHMLTRPLTRPGQLQAAWATACLENIRAGELTIRTDFESFDDYWGPLDGKDGPIPNYLRQTEPVMQAKIKEAVRLCFLDGEDDGPRSYTATSWVVSGTKPGQIF